MKYAIILSLCIHGLFVLGTFYLAPSTVAKSSLEKIEIEVLPASKQKKLASTIVRQATPPSQELLKDIKSPEARFLSMLDQRVKVETQAAHRGLTENHKESPQKYKSQKQVADYSPDGFSARNELAEMNKKLSTVGEALPKNVKIGSFTALNTNRFQFYSFYARIEDLIRFRWESKVQQIIDQLDRSYVIDVIGKKHWTTQVEFWLTRNGDFHSAHIYKESGQKKFDEAPIFAFSNARNFPNPPQEMVESDGYIHLIYNFTVEFNPTPMAQR